MGVKLDDKTGRRFGHLVATEYVGRSYWLCKCDCGNTCRVGTSDLNSGRRTSCGCTNSNAFIDRTYNRVGRLTVLDYLGKQKWLCQCDCGTTTVVCSTALCDGHTQSCGCLAYEARLNANVTHGFTRGRKKERLYHVWRAMIGRCENPNDKSYKNYGGRGIRVCDEWRNSYPSFRLWAMENGYNPDAPKGECTIDRIDVNGNYEPSNCRWADASTQAKNRRPYRSYAKSRAVDLIDSDGNVAKTFQSLRDAREETGCPETDIVKVCRGKRHTVRGMRWRYSESNAAIARS